MEHETIWTLMTDMNHVGFEVIMTIIQDVLIGLIAWPWAKRRFQARIKKEHLALDKEHGITHPDGTEERYSSNVKLVNR